MKEGLSLGMNVRLAACSFLENILRKAHVSGIIAMNSYLKTL